MSSLEVSKSAFDSSDSGLETSHGIEWSDYAARYDLMAEHNPAYQENIGLLIERLRNWSLPGDARICDLGAGTGNYIVNLAQQLPSAEFWHVDCDKTMINYAKEKYVKLGLSNVKIVEDYIQRIDLPERHFDLVVCVNALYAMSPHESTLRSVARSLKPGGKFFVIDFGRKQRVIDWGWYLLKNTIKTQGLRSYVEFVLKSGEIVRQARNGTRFQAEGGYWLHSTQEFGNTLNKCGFLVEDLFPCYRGYCDLAVCSLSNQGDQL
jgi:ubiquinone/menaquinone biosynthesis C-methylase UbiE